jgi:hypothetical protein
VLVPNLVAAQNGLKIVREEFKQEAGCILSKAPWETIAYINRRDQCSETTRSSSFCSNTHAGFWAREPGKANCQCRIFL